MTWMRAEIVGKDDEKFLGDETESPTLKASTEAPAQSPPKPNAPPAASAPTGRPLIKPALSQQFAPVKPMGAVKPALNAAPAPNQPKNKQ
jgi:hypothetical protein